MLGRFLTTVLFVAVIVVEAIAVTNEELAKLVAEDVAKPVRPVGVNGC